MPEREKRGARRAGDLVILLVIPALALACYGPQAWQALAALPALVAHATAAAQAGKGSDGSVLDQWRETQAPGRDPDPIEATLQRELLADVLPPAAAARQSGPPQKSLTDLGWHLAYTLTKDTPAQRAQAMRQATLAELAVQQAQTINEAMKQVLLQSRHVPAGSAQQNLLREKLGLLNQERDVLTQIARQAQSQTLSPRDLTRLDLLLHAHDGSGKDGKIPPILLKSDPTTTASTDTSNSSSSSSLDAETKQILVAVILARDAQPTTVQSSVTAARKQAQGLNALLDQLRAQLKLVHAGSLQQHLLQERISLLMQEKNAINKLVTRFKNQNPSANATRTFLEEYRSLQLKFRRSEQSFAIHQQTERVSGSASSFTLPNF